MATTCGDFSVKSVTDQVGAENILMVPLDEAMRADKPAFAARLTQAREQ